MNKKVCVVGAGRWGKNHIKTLHELGCLAGIVEADADTRMLCGESYPGVKTFANIKDAIKEDFDGFTVATPAETHFKIAEFIISHKKHVLVEKPLTLMAKEARRLKQLAEENNVNLMVGHLLLFHPAIRKVKELIQRGVRPLSDHYFNLYPEDLQKLRKTVVPGLVPPFYADLPKTFDEICESERKYVNAYMRNPARTQWIYFWKAFGNIVFRGARSG